jgi:hypothetical protein
MEEGANEAQCRKVRGIQVRQDKELQFLGQCAQPYARLAVPPQAAKYSHLGPIGVETLTQ